VQKHLAAQGNPGRAGRVANLGDTVSESGVVDLAEHFTVDIQQLRTHAQNVQAVRQRFGAVQGASAHIAQDDQAYGLLCGWISGVLEGRHQKQDELIAYVAENLDMVTDELEQTADAYDTLDNDGSDRMKEIGVIEQ
jgi:excreted virulence factor EspC (type VII ESX diderm)